MQTSRVHAAAEGRRSPLAMAPLVALAFLAVSCGGDDASSASASTSAPAAATESADADASTQPDDAVDPEIGEIDGTEDLAGAIGGKELTDAMDALGIDTRMKILTDQLGGDYEVTGDSSAFIYLDGDVNTDGVMVCVIVGAISSPGDVVVVAYPNGDVVCD
jgi:hypothetical protein